jgi:hypothetical protein
VSPSLIGSAKSIITLISYPVHFETCDTSLSKHGHLEPERYCHSASKLSYDPNSLFVKLSHKLVLTG